MRLVRYTMTFCLLLLVLAVSAKGSTKQTVYMFGFSASFNDSIVYFTPVQQVEAYIANDRHISFLIVISIPISCVISSIIADS